MERFIRTEFLKFKTKKQVKAEYQNENIPFNVLFKHWTEEAIDITKKIFPYVVLGVGIGALIHGFVPEETITKYLSKNTWWTVPSAVALGAPLYANSVGVVPIIEALVGKGIPLGSALAFMTATVTISIPEGLMLSKLMKRRLLLTFFGVTISGIVLMGYLFNFIT
jgi:uncharacterized membrane protein YraQ (UPF0718 family)